MSTLSIIHGCMLEHGPAAYDIILNEKGFKGLEFCFKSSYLLDALGKSSGRINPAGSEAYNMMLDVLFARGETPPPLQNLSRAWLHHIPTPAYMMWLNSAVRTQSSFVVYVGHDWVKTPRRNMNTESTFTPTNAYPKITPGMKAPIDFSLLTKPVVVATKVPIEITNNPGDVRYTSSTQGVLQEIWNDVQAKGYPSLMRENTSLTQQEIQDISDIPWSSHQAPTKQTFSSDRKGVMLGKFMKKEKSFRTREANTLKAMRNSKVKIGDVVIDPKNPSTHYIYSFRGWKFEYCPNPTVIVELDCLNPPRDDQNVPWGTRPNYRLWYKTLGDLKKFVELNGGE